MTECIQVVTTFAERSEAQNLAAVLVQRRLAACVQVSGPIESHYRWQGKVETSQEWLCTIKTRRDLYDALEAAIRELHSYDEPEILATAVVAGSQGYLQWLNEQVEGPQS